jgi:hypothetical protein
MRGIADRLDRNSTDIQRVAFQRMQPIGGVDCHWKRYSRAGEGNRLSTIRLNARQDARYHGERRRLFQV